MICEIIIESTTLNNSTIFIPLNSIINRIENLNIKVKYTTYISELTKEVIEFGTNRSDFIIIISNQISKNAGDNNYITPDFFDKNTIIIINLNEFSEDNFDKIVEDLKSKYNATVNINRNVEELVFELLMDKSFKIGFCESCTGGLISSRFTNIVGISSVFDRGIVTYSNIAKIDEVSVNKDTLEKFGAVSKEVAIEMSRGLLNKAKLDIALSVTGIAGPGGGTKNKPVGLVYIGISTKYNDYVYKNIFKGVRIDIQRQTADKAFVLLMDILKNIDQ